MKYALRPFTAGQAIGAGFSVWIDGFIETLPITLGVFVVMTVSTFAGSGGIGRSTLLLFAGAGVNLLLSLLVSAIVAALVTRRISGLFLADSAKAKRGLFATSLSVCAASGVLTLFLVIPALPLIGVGLIATRLSDGGDAFVWASALSGLLVVALYIVFGIMAVRRYFASVCVVLDDLSFGKALRRSRDLVKGSSWRAFGFILLQSLVTVTITWSLMGLITLLSLDGIASATLTGLGQALSIPLATSMEVVYLLGLRVRREGLDIERAARDFGEPAPDGEAAGLEPSSF